MGMERVITGTATTLSTMIAGNLCFGVSHIHCVAGTKPRKCYSHLKTSSDGVDLRLHLGGPCIEMAFLFSDSICSIYTYSRTYRQIAPVHPSRVWFRKSYSSLQGRRKPSLKTSLAWTQPDRFGHRVIADHDFPGGVEGAAIAVVGGPSLHTSVSGFRIYSG
jgi:hypothetical protein